MPPTLLAFDTATELLSVGVSHAGRVHLRDAAGGASASATLIPAVLGLLDEAGVALRDVDAIVFGRGPGAFTGLRTACSVAQGLAFGAGKLTLPVDTLLAVAESARLGDAVQRVWALLDARMNEIYAAHYEFDGRDWHVVEPPMLTTPEVLNQRWASAAPQCVAGNALGVFGDRLSAGAARLAPQAMPHARALLALAPRLIERGECVDAALALPLYVREKVAQTTAEREAARAAKLEAEQRSQQGLEVGSEAGSEAGSAERAVR